MITVTVTWVQIGMVIGAFVVVFGAFAYHMDKRFDALNERFKRAIEHLREVTTR
jgi:hypothetical protein